MRGLRPGTVHIRSVPGIRVRRNTAGSRCVPGVGGQQASRSGSVYVSADDCPTAAANA
ncbi:hypothetical protein ACHHV8_08085 [Paenibacillus sp. TAB 01]|uniref:hypothetical protein n=1 Tax=Paenibacillus sp. TAB 01 TaxID=3368988 RepID=UPI003750DE18